MEILKHSMGFNGSLASIQFGYNNTHKGNKTLSLELLSDNEGIMLRNNI